MISRCALDAALPAHRVVAKQGGLDRRAVVLRLERPLAQHAVGLAAATRPAEENLFRRALDERVLWARLRRPGPMIWLAHASPGLHELLLPLLGAHRLVANAVHGLELHRVAAQAQVLAQRNQ